MPQPEPRQGHATSSCTTSSYVTQILFQLLSYGVNESYLVVWNFFVLLTMVTLH